MTDRSRRVERDSLGAIEVPTDALYGAQTQRAIENFQISNWRLPPPFIHALALIKRCAAGVNHASGRLDATRAAAIAEAAQAVHEGAHDAQFPVDVFQTGSGTSTNMNANEVIARLATQRCGQPVHPNDHVNLSQSSNDVIPTAIHLSARLEIVRSLVPALEHLATAIRGTADRSDHLVVTGRTHLMDAVPLTMGQQLRGWGHQIGRDVEALQSTLPRLAELAIGGTAIGTGLNAPPAFGADMVAALSDATGVSWRTGRDRFALISSQDTIVELSGQLRTVAVSLSTITWTLRWMSSGPTAGLAEVVLPALQPGSSMMPGKVNPVIPEAVAMACAQVVGHDAAVAVAGQAGRFQLNTMLPLIAHAVLHSVDLLAAACHALADKAIRGMTFNEAHIQERVAQNPVLGTALAPRIGYDAAARIVKKAQSERRAVREVAAELTDLDPDELDQLLDVRRMTGPDHG